jgi:hypothetical protein
VRYSPEKTAVTSHKMAPHMVKPGKSSGCLHSVATAGFVLRQKRSRDLNLFEQCGFSGPCTRSVKTFKHQRPTRQAWTRSEEQKKCQQHGYIDRYRTQYVMSEGGGLNRGQPSPLVVILPRVLESESKAAPQDIRVPDGTIRYANARSLLPAVCSQP